MSQLSEGWGLAPPVAGQAQASAGQQWCALYNGAGCIVLPYSDAAVSFYTSQGYNVLGCKATQGDAAQLCPHDTPITFGGGGGAIGQAPPQPTQPPSGGTPAQGPTTPVATQSGGGEVAASGLCANIGYIPPCVGGWPSPQRPATDGTCDKWVSFVGQIVKLGSLLLQSSGEGNPSRLDSNWVKNVVCACIDFDPGQLRGMPPLEYLYSHLGQCDFSEAYLAIASTVHGLNGGQLQAAYAVKAALEALSSIEYGVNTGYGQDQGEGQHSELGLGI